MPVGSIVRTIVVMLLLGSLAACVSPIEPLRNAAEAAGVRITELARGRGSPATVGALVRVDYTGWLSQPGVIDGKGAKFDSSLDREEPFVFALGQKRVIPGWDLGVAGMQAGGQRRLVIPPELAYGARGTPGGPIPPDATLVFEIELLDFLPPPSKRAPGHPPARSTP